LQRQSAGLDALVFTGGIGEHAAVIRERVCRNAEWLGVELDVEANEEGRLRISTDSSSVSVWAIPANEELMIARHTGRVIEQRRQQLDRKRGQDGRLVLLRRNWTSKDVGLQPN
jgi:acetate kinase